MASESPFPKMTCPVCKGELGPAGKKQDPIRRGTYELHSFACDPCLFVSTRVVDRCAGRGPQQFLSSVS